MDILWDHSADQPVPMIQMNSPAVGMFTAPGTTCAPRVCRRSFLHWPCASTSEPGEGVAAVPSSAALNLVMGPPFVRIVTILSNLKSSRVMRMTSIFSYNSEHPQIISVSFQFRRLKLNDSLVCDGLGRHISQTSALFHRRSLQQMSGTPRDTQRHSGFAP